MEVKEKEQKEELVKRELVENTPFTCVTTEKGSFCVIGKYRVTEIHEKKKEAIEKAVEINWNNIVQAISCIMESFEDFKDLTNKKYK